MFAARSYKNYGVSTDPYFNNTSLLLHGDGTNGAQNNTFLDSSLNNFTITRNGTPTQGSFSPYGNIWSNSFDGSIDYLTIPDNPAFNLGSSDFTAECWVYFNSSVNQYFFGQIQSSTANRSFCLALISSRLYFEVRSGSTAYIVQDSNNAVLNSWIHIAAVRNGNTITLYKNGISVGTVSVTGITVNDSTNLIGVGCGGGYVAEPMNGYISNARLVVGTAVYTSNFTPPISPLTAVSGTSLLTCQSNRFVDNSSNNFAITVNGNVSVSTEAPFSPASEYSIVDNGGSGYFDGSGDYLDTATNALLSFESGNFTIEFWAYINQHKDFINLIDGRPNTFNSAAPLLYTDASGILYYFVNGASRITSSSSLQSNTWFHIGLTRQGTTTRLFINGIQTGSTYSDSTNYTNTSYRIGSARNGIPANAINLSLNGCLSNLRIVKGTAVYTSNFTPPITPVTSIVGTSLLCNFTNAGIFDNTEKNNLITVGNAQISTSVKKYGTGSIAFDGVGDELTIPQNAVFQFGTGDFTIECWVYCTNLAGGTGQEMQLIDFRSSQVSEVRPTIAISGGTFLYFTAGANRISSGSISDNTWYHVAVSRVNGITRMFVNGTKVGVDYVDSNSYLISSPIIGSAGSWISGYDFVGYMDDIRITKGVGRYAANFTPPQQAFPNL